MQHNTANAERRRKPAQMVGSLHACHAHRGGTRVDLRIAARNDREPRRRRGRGSVPRLRTDAWCIAMACRPPTTPDWTVVDGESALREDDALKWTALHMPIPDKPPSTTRRWRMQSLSPAPWLRWTTARGRRCKACGMGRRTVRPGRRPPGRVQQRLRSLAPFTEMRSQ